jgi:hypothetical protein
MLRSTEDVGHIGLCLVRDLLNILASKAVCMECSLAQARSHSWRSCAKASLLKTSVISIRSQPVVEMWRVCTLHTLGL